MEQCGEKDTLSRMGRSISTDWWGNKTYTYYNDYNDNVEATYTNGHLTYYRKYDNDKILGLIFLIVIILIIFLYIILPFIMCYYFSKWIVSFIDKKYNLSTINKKLFMVFCICITYGSYIFYIYKIGF